ncbi:MAG: ATPase [Gammaproteobacteria bacterium]|nr:ATPase [Gammaproteobacteria bacterium]MDX2462599.1 ATPase [Gammaproteobacteria bacterium]
MHLTPREFANWEHKAITLLGMSGIGKTTLANKLPKTEWFHYSADYRIGTKYLEEPILDNIKHQAMKVDFLRDLLLSDSIYIRSNITVHNLAPVSTFLGKIGDHTKGGLSLAEFKERQRLHHEAEIAAMKDIAPFIAKARQIYGYNHFLNDAGGSVCELNDAEAIQCLADNSLIIYIRADEAMENTLIQRAIDSPKPLYYQERFLDERLGEFMAADGISEIDAIDPDKFVRWMFPKLVEHRRPLYQGIADQHGYTVESGDVEQVRDEADILELITDALNKSDAVKVSAKQA